MTHSFTNTTPPIAGLPDFWQRVAMARHRFLVLDYDGTLAPFHENRMEAKPLPESLRALRAILLDTRTILAIVSGRPLSELKTLLPDFHVAMVGSHGWEIRHADGRSGDPGVSSTQREGLKQVFALAQTNAPANLVERKTASVALHTRPLPPEQAAALQADIEARWRPVIDRHEMELRHFNGGIEARALGHNKGTALQTLLKEVPSDAVVVYIGDDETDEDAFAAVAGRGIGIKVGALAAETSAKGQVGSCHTVSELLVTWAKLAQ